MFYGVTCLTYKLHLPFCPLWYLYYIINLPFSLDEIKKGIKQLNSNKSSGPDLYINEMFIHSKDVLAFIIVI